MLLHFHVGKSIFTEMKNFHSQNTNSHVLTNRQGLTKLKQLVSQRKGNFDDVQKGDVLSLRDHTLIF